MFHPTLWDTVHVPTCIRLHHLPIHREFVCVHDVGTVILFKAQIF